MIVWKRLTYRFLACLLGGLILPAVSSTPRKGNADIPALLQFAEQYKEKAIRLKNPLSRGIALAPKNAQPKAPRKVSPTTNRHRSAKPGELRIKRSSNSAGK
ncbi:hypothetical protein [Serratia bockelmannii]|uniref:hypothetical protein n=1 Tax=Serratia bockelmannii TaxID=2703793 RepID=UPI003F6B55A7